MPPLPREISESMNENARLRALLFSQGIGTRSRPEPARTPVYVGPQEVEVKYTPPRQNKVAPRPTPEDNAKVWAKMFSQGRRPQQPPPQITPVNYEITKPAIDESVVITKETPPIANAGYSWLYPYVMTAGAMLGSTAYLKNHLGQHTEKSHGNLHDNSLRHHTDIENQGGSVYNFPNVPTNVPSNLRARQPPTYADITKSGVNEPMLRWGSGGSGGLMKYSEDPYGGIKTEL